MRNKHNDETNCTYETTDAQPQNCTRGIALERSVGKQLGGGYQSVLLARNITLKNQDPVVQS